MTENKGTIALKNLLEEVKNMTPEEYMKLYNSIKLPEEDKKTSVSIGYEVRIMGTCITPCKHYKERNRMVGSCACLICDHFVSDDEKAQIVECKHPDNFKSNREIYVTEKHFGQCTLRISSECKCLDCGETGMKASANYCSNCGVMFKDVEY